MVEAILKKGREEVNKLQVFENSQFGQLRYHIDADGIVWFCAKDIATALEYPESSLNQINNLMASIPKEWVALKSIMGNGGIREALCLAESGIYFFLGRFDKPKALPYQKWVAGEVLPSIGQNRLYEALRDHGYLIKRGSDRNQPTQYAMNLGLFEVKKTAVTHSDGQVETKTTTKVTGRGQIYFVN